MPSHSAWQAGCGSADYICLLLLRPLVTLDSDFRSPCYTLAGCSEDVVVDQLEPSGHLVVASLHGSQAHSPEIY